MVVVDWRCRSVRCLVFYNLACAGRSGGGDRLAFFWGQNCTVLYGRSYGADLLVDFDGSNHKQYRTSVQHGTLRLAVCPNNKQRLGRSLDAL
jgi:hypothetical protein